MTDEQRRRVHEITYSTDDREELAERIVRLEDERDLYSSLVEDMDHPDTANQLRAENAKLQDENARLRSCLSDDVENARQIMAENAKLRKAMDFQALELGCMTDNRDILYLENAKLRELVRDMLEEIEVYGLDPIYEEDPSWRVGIRELGIEVEDA